MDKKNKNLTWNYIVFFTISAIALTAYYLEFSKKADEKDFAFNSDKGMHSIEEVLRENFLYAETIEPERLRDGAIKGMVESLGDPYTMYFSEHDYNQRKEDIEGSFGGIGISVSEAEGEEGVAVESVQSGHGAEEAGLQPDDIILEVDGVEVKEMPVKEATNLMKGESGTTVSLKVKRKGIDKPIVVKIKRGDIEIQNVSHRFLNDETAYIRINMFSNNTAKQLENSLKEIEEKKSKNIVLDLRSNVGGVVEQAVQSASMFLGENKDLVKVRQKEKTSTLKTKKPPIQTDLPLMVLADENTASSSEILISSLKEHGRAKVIGEKTKGKGLIQENYSVGDKGILSITTKEYVSIKDEPINKNGITPNYELHYDMDLFLQGRDIHLEKAVELLSKK